MNTWNFDIIDDYSRIWSDEHLRRWNTLLDAAARKHVFAHPMMAKAWIETYMPLRSMRPLFVWAKDKDGHQALMPLMLWRKNWKNCFTKTIVPVGYSDFDYHDPVADTEIDDRYYSELTAMLQSRYPVDEILIDGITDMSIGDTLGWEKGEICPKLRIEGLSTEADLFGFLKTSLRGDIRRQMRRLDAIGRLHMVEYKTKEDAMGTFDTFMCVHRSRWPNAYKAPHFHENLLSEGMLGTVTHFSSLNVGDTPAAWHLGFEYDGVYYYYMPTGNPNYMAYSPVKVHLFMLMARAIEKGYHTYDHLRGDENYKQGWSNDAEYVNTLRVISDGLGARLRHAGIELRKRLLH